MGYVVASWNRRHAAGARGICCEYAAGFEILTGTTQIYVASLDPKAKHVEKILDVQQGEISCLVGTIYMDMKLKPNILDDITKDVRMKGKDDISGLYVQLRESNPELTLVIHATISILQHWIAAQPDRPKYTDDTDSVYLEDESGRVRLTGVKITNDFFVTGMFISLGGPRTRMGLFT